MAATALRVFFAAIASIGVLAAQSVTTGFGNNGLTSLTYNGIQYLSSGTFFINQVILTDSSGNSSNGSVTGTTTVNASQGQVTQTYPWGTVQLQYTPAGNRLNLAITTTNTTPQTITGLFYNVFNLQFPSAVQEYDGVDPMVDSNIGAPTALSMTSTAGVMVLANDDVSKPLMAGFPWSLNSPANTVFPLRVNTNQDPMYPTFWPFINRPIAPGASDTYHLSLRFGPAGSTLQSLAGDVYQSFGATFPSQVNWPDRRPIGMLVLGTSNTGWPTNPRGWLLDPTIDVTTPAGLANFQSRILQWANNSVQVLKEANAQGMITWDIEGEQFPQPTTYVCDPTQFLSTAPEMANVADAYFQVFRNAGLRVGVCVRPQQFVLGPGGTTASQQDVADPVPMMINKIEYAKQRWGASMFYIDSDGGPNNPTDPSVFQRLSAAEPDVLLVPEHSETQYWAYSAPYRQLNQGAGATPAQPRAIYPSSFSVINVADAPLSADFQSLVTAVSQGDALMFRGWFDDGSLSTVQSVYQQAAPYQQPAPDKTPPTVSITAPLGGATVGGTITVAASATDNVGVASVQFALDGTSLGAPDTSAPYTATLVSTSFANGSHTLTATATDTSGNMATASVTVTISNVATPPPAAACPGPSISAFTGCYYSGESFNTFVFSRVDPTINFNWSGTGPQGPVALGPDDYSVRWQGSFAFLAGVYQFTVNTADGDILYLDGQAIYSNWTIHGAVPVTVNATLTAGTHLVELDYYKDVGSAEAQLSWTLISASPVATPPSVSISSPANGATVSGTVTLTANAASTAGIASVQFVVDGANLGSPVTAAPYSLALNTATLANGSHTITATAKDTAGNSATSSPVTITVNNVTVTAPGVSVTSPSNGAFVSGSITVTASATSSIGIASVQFVVDGANFGSPDTTSPYSLALNTTSLSNGPHTIAAMAKDTAGNSTTSATVTITVNNVTVTPPSVSITSPANGATVSGSLAITASATSSIGIASVQFQLDAANLGSPVAAAPYAWTVDTTTLTNGTHTLDAMAKDTAGNSTTSATVTITVSNAPTSAGCATPGTNVFTGCYYSGQNFNTFVFMRTDTAINFDWSGTGPQGPIALGPDHYSVRWLGNFQFQAATYQFIVNTDDGDVLYVDGQVVYSNWIDHGAVPVTVNVPLTAGTHTIRLDYYQDEGSAMAQLSWQIPPKQ
ncbi:MAG TPA: Ig-like domain-containing protein [Verrucomicrobiae bacterium]|nr:Ig-like domain-containing protein [Verrucomicrobiae bacterium]